MSETFEEHQARMARELGYGGDVALMNKHHDPLHRALCAWLGVTSLAMREAAGETLSKPDHHLAVIEEGAVLAVQRLMRAHGADVPR